MKRILNFYHHHISPYYHLVGRLFFGSFFSCRYQPTCSQYYATAVAKYGIIHGSVLGLKRFFRCHPYSKTPPFDPVP